MEGVKYISQIRTFLDDYLFKTSRFHALGILRFAIIFEILRHAVKHFRGMGQIAYYGYAQVHEPSLLLKLLPIPFPIPPDYTFLFALVFYLSALAAMLGIFTRVSLFVFACMFVYRTGLDAIMGTFNHEASLSTQVLFILAFSPGVTSFSVDKLVKWLFLKSKGIDVPLVPALVGPAVPLWGVRLILLMLGMVYFTAGLSKVRLTDGKWLNGETLAYYIGSASPFDEQIGIRQKKMFIGPKAEVPVELRWRDGYGITSHAYTNWQRNAKLLKINSWLASQKTFMKVLSVLTIILELSGLVLLSTKPWIRSAYLASALLLHISIGLILKVPFPTYQVLCFLLIDWKWIYYKIKGHLPEYIQLSRAIKV